MKIKLIIGMMMVMGMAGIARGAAQEKTWIFLLWGQSNMKGRGDVAELPASFKTPDPRISMFHFKDDKWCPAKDPMHSGGDVDAIDKSGNAGVGPGLAFARKMAEMKKGVKIGLVPCAQGGSVVELWKPGAKLYVAGIERARKALASVPGGGEIKGVLWLQGESDAMNKKNSAGVLRKTVYEKELCSVVDGVRKDLGIPDLPFIAGTVGEFSIGPNKPYIKEINAILLKLPSLRKNTACVDARDLMSHLDVWHFDTAAQLKYGPRYAEKFLSLTEKAGKGGK